MRLSFVEKMLPAKTRRRRSRERFREEFHVANAEASGFDERQELAARYRYEVRLLDAEDALDDTKTLVREARRLRVPVPPVGTPEEEHRFWDEGPHGRTYLSPAGFKEIRKEIRAEKTWRREQRNSWLVWISAVTGLVGALTGLLAVILS